MELYKNTVLEELFTFIPSIKNLKLYKIINGSITN